MIQQRSDQKGYVLILVLVMSAVFLTIGLSIASLVSTRYASSKRTTFVENAIFAADAGVTDTLNVLFNDNNFTGYGTTKQLYSDADRGKAEYTTSVTYDSIKKLFKITSKGYAYRAPGDVTPINTKDVEVTAALTNSSIPARMAAGSGGLVVNRGKVGGQNIWVNGTVSVINGGTIGGTAFGWLSPTADATLNVAGVGCGTNISNPAYPTKCVNGSGVPTQPVQVSSDSSIYGTVCANNQTDAAGIYTGQQGGKGLIVSCSAPSIVMPKYDRQALYNSMTQSTAGYTCQGYYPAPVYRDLAKNTIYTSSVSILSGASTCDTRITGNVYIEGNLTVDGFGRTIRVADSDAQGNPITTPPIVAVEGTISMASEYATIEPNIHGVGAVFISFKSLNAVCDGNPACNSLSASDLYNSRNLETILIDANQTKMAPMVFYSYFGTLYIKKGSVGGAAGQRIVIDSEGNWRSGTQELLVGGLTVDSFTTGDAFGGKVQIPVWNIITYRQTYPNN